MSADSNRATPLNPTNALPRTTAAIRTGIADGLHLGGQVAVALRGEIVGNFAAGDAAFGLPMSPGTLLAWLSAGKPLLAVAIAQLWEQGKLDLDDAAARFIPEFGANGKTSVTIRHLLTHTAGLRAWGTNWHRPADAVRADLYAMPLEAGWVPGERAGYHPQSSWFVLAEILRRLSGQSFAEYVDQQICNPLGMTDARIGMTDEAFTRYADAGRLATTFDTTRGPPSPTRPPPSRDDLVRFATPGGGLRATARDLATFYSALLAGGRGVIIAQTVAAISARQRVGMVDKTFGRPIDWGLGFLINSEYLDPADPPPYGYGPHASLRTFGHSGNQCSCAFGDPEHGLAVAWCCNGHPGEPRHQQRQRAINAAIYEDLGLASSPVAAPSPSGSSDGGRRV